MMGFLPKEFNNLINGEIIKFKPIIKISYNGKVIKFKSHPLLFSDGNKTYVIEEHNKWLSKRNHRIAMRRALVILGFMAAIWGVVIWVVN